jgi:ubiquitin C-terminal hydrolase
MDAAMPAPLSPQASLSQINPPTPPSDPAMDIDSEEKQELIFDFDLKNMSAPEESRVYSPWRLLGGFKWRLLIFPRGNQIESDMSVYLECGGPADDASLASTTQEPAAAKTSSPDMRTSMQKKTAIAMTAAVDPSGKTKIEANALMDITTNNSAAQRTEDEPMTAPTVDNVEEDINRIQSNPSSRTDVIDATGKVHVPSPDDMPPAVVAPRYPKKSKEPAPHPVVPQSWTRPARFWLSIRPTARTPPRAMGVSKETSHIFREKETDWGFREFCPLARIAKDFLHDENGTVWIDVRIRLQDASPDSMFNTATWDSRKSTGYVGFKNQGATCYMNSLLQTLYMLGAFRRAVYNMPLPNAEDEAAGGSKMSYALQKVFYELQYSTATVKTKTLTESFGWDNTDAFTQHDVQELNRILCDHLEERMKKIAPGQPNTISQLFEGKILNYIECVNVEYKSTREESFYDLSLNVKGCRNIYESFDKYCEVEMMDGDNKYRADGFADLQEAKKGVKFLRLPPVLQLHLKRFEYDFHRDAMVKINDRFEYAIEIDLSPYVDKSDGKDIYVLHSVLVHVGDVNGGHYYVFIRPTTKSSIDPESNEPPANTRATWYKFDDDSVTAALEDNAVTENFGSGGERDTSNLTNSRLHDDMVNSNATNDLNGTHTPPHQVYHQARVRNYASRRVSNAYMLQYIRKDQAEELLLSAKDSDVPKSLASRISSEQAEEDRRRRDHAEQHLFMTVAVATDEYLADFHGVDFIDWSKVKQVRVKRAMLLKELKQSLQDNGLVINAKRMRLWRCEMRQNDSVRPETLLANGVDDSPIAEPGRDYYLHHGQYGLGYQTRYGHLGDDMLKLYVEDFMSPFCFGAGDSFSRSVANLKARNDTERALPSNASTVSPSEEQNEITLSAEGNGTAMKGRTPSSLETSCLSSVSECDGRLETDSKGLSDSSGFSSAKKIDETNCAENESDLHLVGGEMLLFFKRYIPSPVPRLDWAGHCIMDRRVAVRQLLPILRQSVHARRELFPSTPPLDPSAELVLYEEWSAEKISELDFDSKFEKLQIPLGNCKAGDIIVFMNRSSSVASREVPVDRERICSGNAFRLPSKLPESGYNPLLPLGGRPLLTPVEYYGYLQMRFKVEFKNRFPPVCSVDGDGSGLVLELLRQDTYSDVRRILACALGDDCDADHLRFFSHDFHRDGPSLEPVRNLDTDEIQRMLASQTLGSVGPGEYRTLWYERTEYAISEYQKKEEVRIMWRPDGGAHSTPVDGMSLSPDTSPANAAPPKSLLESCSRDLMADDGNESELAANQGVPQGDRLSSVEREISRAFSVLIPFGSLYDDVAAEVRAKVGLDESVGIRLAEVRNFRISQFLDLSNPINRSMSAGFVTAEFGTELRAEPISDEELADVGNADVIQVSVSHMAKDSKQRAWRGPTYFGVPFVLRINKEGETVGSIRDRIRRRLGVPDEVFSTWKLAEVSQARSVYLEDPERIWSPDHKNHGGVEICALAIEHHGSVPTKKPSAASTRYADKPLKIRG